MSEELKPCPFCGGKAEIHIGPNMVDKKSGRYEPSITCESCGIGFLACHFGRGFCEETANDITVEFWNRRAETGRAM